MQIKRGLLVGSSNYSVQIQFAPEKITVRYAVKMKKTNVENKKIVYERHDRLSG